MSLEGKCSMEKADLSLNENNYKLHLQLSFYLNQGNKYISYLHVNARNIVEINVFSSPELKAQVSFSDRLLSVVRPSVCLSVCL